MENRDIDCVLFDLDNTLIPFLPALRTWARAWARPLVPPGKRSRFARELIGNTLKEGEDPGTGVATTLSRWNIHVDDSVLARAETQADQAYQAALDPYDGIQQAIAHLHQAGIETAIVTDAPDQRATERLDATGLAGIFEIVITRDHTPRGKHGPEPFHKAMGLLDAPADRTAMVGDWPLYDVRWPKRLGMRTVLAGWGTQSDPHALSASLRPWAVAGHPADLPSLVMGHDPATPRLPTPTNTVPLTAF